MLSLGRRYSGAIAVGRVEVISSSLRFLFWKREDSSGCSGSDSEEIEIISWGPLIAAGFLACGGGFCGRENVIAPAVGGTGAFSPIGSIDRPGGGSDGGGGREAAINVASAPGGPASICHGGGAVVGIITSSFDVGGGDALPMNR